MKRNGNSDSCRFQPLLHDPVATTLAHREELVLFKNTAKLQARKNTKLTQPVPQLGL